MKNAHRFNVEPGWRLLMLDMGLQPGDALRLAGLPADLFARRGASLSAQQYFALWQALQQLAGERELPLMIAETVSTESFSPTLFAALCSPDLDTALKRISRFKRLLAPMDLDVAIRDGHTTATLHLDLPEAPIPIGVGLMEMAFLTQLARRATRTRIEPLAVTLRALPANLTAYRGFFGCTPTRGAHYSVRFDARDAQRPFLTEDAGMWRFFEPGLQQRLSDLDASASMRDRVHGALLQMLPGGESSIGALASRLSMSPRTLQRHLAAESLSYQSVLDATRRELARHYLDQSSIAPGEIAYLLGFHDPNSFLRAFKSWTGQSPGAWRRDRGAQMPTRPD